MTSKFRLTLPILLSIFVFCGSLTGASLYVATTGDDTNGNGSQVAPYSTIQKAVDSASNGDAILVLPGTYAGSGNREINTLGKLITIQSSDGPLATIIDCGNKQAFIANSGETRDTIIDGFSITNGYVSSGRDWSGHGIIHMENCAYTIRNCIFYDNSAVATYLTTSMAIIYKHSGDSEAGLVENCLFYNNSISDIRWTSVGGGFGGLAIGNSAGGINPLDVKFCTFADNTLNNSGGITMISYSGGTISNCVEYNNQGLYWRGEPTKAFYGPEVSYCLTSHDVPNGSVGVLSGDPIFLSEGGINYALAEGSPAIDSGDPSLLDPDGSRADMGFRLDRFTSTTDTDGDGLNYSVETNTGVYISETNTGTDPNNADSDGDGVPDGLEITEGTDPTDSSDFNSFSTGIAAWFPFTDSVENIAGTSVSASNNNAQLSYSEELQSPILSYGFNQWMEISGLGDYISGDPVTISGYYKFGSGVNHPREWGSGFKALTYSNTLPDGTSPQFRINVSGSPYQSVQFNLGGNQEIQRPSLNMETDTWYYFTVVVDPNATTKWKFFLNGALYASGSEGVPDTLNFGYNYWLGASSDGDAHYYGTDSIGANTKMRFYNRALSTSEVSALYYSEAPQYQIIEGDFTWQEAKADAEARGGRLAVLNTQEKIDAANEYLLSLGTWNYTFIGLTDEEVEGSWKWVTGELLTVNNWNSGEPNGGTRENYTEIIQSSHGSRLLWNDTVNDGNADLPRSYLLELISVPEPLAPVLDLETLYESNSGESITIDATPTDGYPSNYTYQWSFKAVGNNSYFVIPSNFGGTLANYQISGNSGYNGTWKVEVTNDTGTTFAEFEYRVFTDADSDGLSDGQEEFVLGTDPNDNDSDDDTLLDGAETNTGTWISASDTGTDPLSNDSDSDGLLDGVETNTAEYIDASDTGTDPNDSDTDNDGVPDGAETNTDVYVSSSDTGTHPLNTDSDADGYSDYVETNTGTWISIGDTGTDPNLGDTDNDGIIDGRETNTGTFVSLTDTGTDPNNTDSDGDGFTDIYEINTSYDPTNSEDTPDAVLVVKTAIELEFHGASGGTYRIEHSTDLGSWTTVEDNIQGESALVERLHSIDDYNHRFFRVIRTDQ
jgi:hypothetical protein